MVHISIMRKSFYVNIFLIIVKVLSGIFFSSVALIADGVHSTSDLMSDVFVLLGMRQVAKPADDDHPFGHGKFEYVLSLFLGISVILVAYNLGKSVIENFNIDPVIPSPITLVIVVIVVIAKFILSRYLLKQGELVDSEIIRASGKESLTDVYSSVIVFVGIISVLLGEYFHQDWMLKGDKVASVFIALFIVKIGVEIIVKAVQNLLGKAVSKEICDSYKEAIEQVQGVIKVDHIDMISYGPYYQALVTIVVDGNMSVKDGHEIAEIVTSKMEKNEKINHVIVHVNPEE